MGWFDEDGYLYLADRATDMILVGGANVYPAEVEAALDEHPAVLSAPASSACPTRTMAASCTPSWRPRGDVTDDELRSHLRAAGW